MTGRTKTRKRPQEQGFRELIGQMGHEYSDSAVQAALQRQDFAAAFGVDAAASSSKAEEFGLDTFFAQQAAAPQTPNVRPANPDASSSVTKEPPGKAVL